MDVQEDLLKGNSNYNENCIHSAARKSFLPVRAFANGTVTLLL